LVHAEYASGRQERYGPDCRCDTKNPETCGRIAGVNGMIATLICFVTRPGLGARLRRTLQRAGVASDLPNRSRYRQQTRSLRPSPLSRCFSCPFPSCKQPLLPRNSYRKVSLIGQTTSECSFWKQRASRYSKVDELASLFAKRPELAEASSALELDTALEASVRLLTGGLKNKLDVAAGFPDLQK